MSRSVDEPRLDVEVWPTAAGSLVFPLLDRVSAARRVAAVLSEVAPGSAVVLADQDVRDGLLAKGALTDPARPHDAPPPA